MSAEKILVIEDEIEIANLVRDYLKASGYDVLVANEGHDGLEKFESFKPDMAIIDIMLPGLDGFEISRQIRAKSAIPILILSARKEDSDKILGLGLGADDYVTKPFSPRELIARVQSHMRRFKELTNDSGNAAGSGVLRLNNIEIDPNAYTVKVRGEYVPFSVKEFEILYYMAKNMNQALSREKIFDNIWGFNEYGDINTVTVHVRKIREKIEEDPSNPKHIETVWGIGYKFRGGQ